MLFLGHVRPQNEEDVRQSTWKEVIHKANVKLMRVPINAIYSLPGHRDQTCNMTYLLGHPSDAPNSGATGDDYFPPQFEDEGKADEYAYQLVIIEDLDDDRVHSFEDDEEKPGPCEDVELAGIRETVPLHELAKIFYADTGKILNIGTEGETNSPILLLKRDLNAVPPRRMMDRYNDAGSPDRDDNNSAMTNPILPNGHQNGASHFSHVEGSSELVLSQSDLSSATASPRPSPHKSLVQALNPWRLPPDLDPEWLAFEVYI